MSSMFAGDEHAAVTALRASEQRFRDLAESIPHLIWTCTGDGTCDYLSPQWVAYTGIPAAAQLGNAWLAQLHPDDVDEAQARWAAAATMGSVFDIQFRIRRNDGVYRWFQTRATPTLDDAGRIARWFGSNTDIQDLRDAQTASACLAQDLAARVRARTDELYAANLALMSVAGQLQVAQRITHAGSWEWTLSDHRVAWSEELYRIVGLAPGHAAPTFAAQEALYTPGSWAELSAAVEHSIATGDGYECTLELVRPDGERRTAIARAETMRDATGAVVKLLGTLQDVTELAQVRGALERLSERMQVATSAANVGIWEWGLDDNSLVWDHTMHRLYGTTPAAFEGAYGAWQSGLHPDDRAATETELQDAVAGKLDFQTPFRVVWKDGSVHHLRPAAAVQRDPTTGRAVRVIGVNWDITEQRVAELALRRTEALQRGILAHAGSAIIATDCDGAVTLFNRAAEELLGYTASELIERANVAVFHDLDEVRERSAVLERELGRPLGSPFEVFACVAVQSKSEAREWTYVRKDGSRVPVLLTVSALRDDAGAISGYLGVAVDLTFRKQQEDALVEVNRRLAERSAQAESASHAKSMFLANMSHEIRTPMNVIAGLTYLLMQTQLSEDQREIVLTLKSATKTLLGMINDVLDLSKIEAHQLTLDESPFQLSQVLDDIGAMMGVLAADKRLALVIEAGDAGPEQLIGDSIRLTQILTNLVGNAIKFTETGTVRLAAHVEAVDGDRSWVRFAVHDTGAGIDEYLLPKLFTPFTQADDPSIRRAGGTGLGLAIVRQLATLMGGEAGVASTRGVGSEFWCRIPFTRVARARRGSSPIDLSLMDVKLMIVQPDGAQRASLASLARRCSWHVQEQASSDHLLEVIHAQARDGHGFDVIVLDCTPPAESAFDLLDAIRASTALDPQPAILLTTALGLSAAQADLRAQHASAVLGTPTTASALFNAITEALRARSVSMYGASGGDKALPGKQRLSGTRLLVVDDSKLNQIVATWILEREGARVEIAEDGLAAVARVHGAQDAFDAVLMDVQMPGLDGIEATRRIRALASCAGLPIIAVTAGAMASDRQRALTAGVNEVISKPFDPEVVVASLRKYIQRVRRHSRQLPRLGTLQLGWPPVDGIDARDMQRRLGGHTEVFLSLLRTFVAEPDDLPGLERTLAMAPSGPDLAHAIQRMHKLRGTAGSLGARDLETAAGEAEQALREAQLPDARAALRRASHELARVRGSACSVLEAASPVTHSAAPIDPVGLAALTRYVRDHHMDAASAFAALSPALVQALGAKVHAQLSSLLDRLEFDAALEILQPMELRGSAR